MTEKKTAQCTEYSTVVQGISIPIASDQARSGLTPSFLRAESCLVTMDVMMRGGKMKMAGWRPLDPARRRTLGGSLAQAIGVASSVLRLGFAVWSISEKKYKKV